MNYISNTMIENERPVEDIYSMVVEKDIRNDSVVKTVLERASVYALKEKHVFGKQKWMTFKKVISIELILIYYCHLVCNYGRFDALATLEPLIFDLMFPSALKKERHEIMFEVITQLLVFLSMRNCIRPHKGKYCGCNLYVLRKNVLVDKFQFPITVTKIECEKAVDVLSTAFPCTMYLFDRHTLLLKYMESVLKRHVDDILSLNNYQTILKGIEFVQEPDDHAMKSCVCFRKSTSKPVEAIQAVYHMNNVNRDPYATRQELYEMKDLYLLYMIDFGSVSPVDLDTRFKFEY